MVVAATPLHLGSTALRWIPLFTKWINHMQVYLLILLICLIPNSSVQNRVARLRPIVIFIVGIFLCFGYMTGSDWRAYEQAYDSLDPRDPFVGAGQEYGYLLYMSLFRAMSVDFWTFFILTKVMAYLVIVRYLLKLKSDHINLAFALFVSMYGLSLFIDNPMRMLIAAAIYSFAFRCIEERRPATYLGFVGIASAFHITTLALAPLYWLTRRRLSVWSVVLFYVAANVLLWTLDGPLREIFKIDTGIDYIDMRTNYYFGDSSFGTVYSENRVLSLGLIIRFILFALFVMSKNGVERKYGHVFFNLVLFAFVSHRLAISVPIFGRFEFYLCVPFCIAMVEIGKSMSKELEYPYYGAVALLAASAMMAIVTYDYKYIPYSNYLSYCLDDPKPSFEERSWHNFVNSPYANTESIFK